MNQPKHLDLHETILVLLIAAVIGGGFISYKYLRVEISQPRAQGPNQAASDDRVAQEVSDALPQNPGASIPSTNPFDETNPFSDVYENPFE